MKTKRQIFLISIISIFILFICTLLLIINFDRIRPKTSIGFYGLSDKQKQSFTTQINNTTIKGKKIFYRYYIFNNPEELTTKNLKKIDLLITSKNVVINNYLKDMNTKQLKKIAMPQNILEGTTTSVNQSAIRTEEGLISLIPLLLDNCEIDINRNLMNQCGVKEINSFKDIEDFALVAKKYIENPIIFAGGDSDILLSFIGALTEALSGKAAYTEMVEAILKTNPSDYDNLLHELSDKPDSPLYNTIKLITLWNKNNLIHSEVFNMSQEELQIYMDINRAPITFMTLTAHRQNKSVLLDHYSSIYYPSENLPSKRFFPASIIAAVPLSASKKTQETINALISVNIQENLCRETGLAPVLAHCKVVDRQADDVRYWIAGTNAPLIPLKDAAFINSNDKKLFASKLGLFIKFAK